MGQRTATVNSKAEPITTAIRLLASARTLSTSANVAATSSVTGVAGRVEASALSESGSEWVSSFGKKFINIALALEPSLNFIVSVVLRDTKIVGATPLG
ncbi:MAG: hypothetical protein WCK15_24320, partial [Pirellula sp.]